MTIVPREPSRQDKGSGSGKLLPALFLLAIAACAQPVDLELPITPRATGGPPATDSPPTPEPPPSMLVVCLGQEPESLYRFGPEYLYGSTGRAAETVLQAVYDGPLDVVGYGYQPTILEKLPDLADGDARLQRVEAGQGSIYLNPDRGQPDSLDPGDRFLPAGCRSGNCAQTYAGGTVAMDQMVVDFQLRSDVNWSDGEPVAARDSVFAFELDRNVNTPTPKTQVDRTASYAAVNEQTVRWTGIPGYLDSEYFANFWSPLPAHQLGERSAAELLSAPETTQHPLGWGPYVIEEWRSGNDITLRKNPGYYRAAEGLPAFETLLFRFIGGRTNSNIEQLLTSECDVLDESATADALNVSVMDSQALSTLRQFENQGRLQIAAVPGAEIERLEFGLLHSSGLPTLFGDPDTRRGLAACVNRERLALELLQGLSELPGSYLPPTHPQAIASAEPLVYDPSHGIELLEQAGWVDEDDDPSTPRVARRVADVSGGTELRFRLLTTPDGYHQAAAELIRSDLANCGARLEVDYLPQDELLQPWPQGPVFGRQFDAVLWAWPSWVSPLCEMYSSREIPSNSHELGINAAGFSDAAYDGACDQLLFGLPGEAGYASGAAQTQQTYAALLPSIPLYMRPRVIAYGANVCGFDLQPAAFSALWNLEQLRPGTEC